MAETPAEIVAGLRDAYPATQDMQHTLWGDLLDEAAALIERQAAEIAELRAEVERLRNPWRPIDDEAKRLPEILAYSEHGGTGTMLVRWIAMVDFLTDSEIEEFARQGASDEMLETPDWFYADFVHGDRLSPDCYPTHYMPVPADADHMDGER